MPLLLLVRHGENDYSKTGKLAGRLPGVSLNERGRKEAEELGKALVVLRFQKLGQLNRCPP